MLQYQHYFYLFVLSVVGPKLFEIMFKTQEQIYDIYRYALLEWVLDVDHGTVKRIRDIRDYQKFAVVILTLQYLVQVYSFYATSSIVILILNVVCTFF